LDRRGVEQLIGSQHKAALASRVADSLAPLPRRSVLPVAGRRAGGHPGGLQREPEQSQHPVSRFGRGSPNSATAAAATTRVPRGGGTAKRHDRSAGANAILAGHQRHEVADLCDHLAQLLPAGAYNRAYCGTFRSCSSWARSARLASSVGGAPYHRVTPAALDRAVAVATFMVRLIIPLAVSGFTAMNLLE
jgi:hypothetical protein